LAFCRAVVSPAERRGRFGWVGRRGMRPVHDAVRGVRCVMSRGIRSDQQQGNCGGQVLTVAEALLGTVAALAILFGALVMDLQAYDNGSGRLVDFYESLGFRKSGPQQEGHMQLLEAQANALRKLAPFRWVSQLVPQDFDAPAWWNAEMSRQRIERALAAPGFRWKCGIAWPHGATIQVRFYRDARSKERVRAEAGMYVSSCTELALCHGSLLLDQRMLRILWIGRSRSRPVETSIRGHRAYRTCCDAQAVLVPKGDSKHTSGCVTAAVALLGVMAAVARWFDVTRVRMNALDDGSGKLLHYLGTLGFTLPQGAREAKSSLDMPVVEAVCKDVAWRCCPAELSSELPSEDDVSKLALPPSEDAAFQMIEVDMQPTKIVDGPRAQLHSIAELQTTKNSSSFSESKRQQTTATPINCGLGDAAKPGRHLRQSASVGRPRTAHTDRKCPTTKDAWTTGLNSKSTSLTAAGASTSLSIPAIRAVPRSPTARARPQSAPSGTRREGRGKQVNLFGELRSLLQKRLED